MGAVTVRPYRPADHGAGRQLWGELTERHRELYDDPGFGGADPTAAFEEYLTRLDLSGVWVADHPDDGVIGLVGLIVDGRRGAVEPIVVADGHRGRGVATTMLGFLAAEARRRGLTSLTVTPESRNVEAIACLHAAGFTVLSSIELTLDLGHRPRAWRDGPQLHALDFRS
ncbi:ribosomal protein S18 acetylase RimI-like enzyme [Catenuloplanes nepalensis]|uniref:Ribosomal protein S18 acetylase RimI-like enzyme n=1 Tax=Catenuloplanes nepalensis TaxID=587533 RepID=A0ABT9N4D1_9ACTN|nr:GNAT family N-acetyltransferase [Catenuloplanes nepalensis]MDP9798560.1 ribosomal protein S18 acetylase RimI-like enzyme [Catenuloplanes nepalensis]